MDAGILEMRERIIDNAVMKIEEIMMYRGCMPEEGQLREILEKVLTDTMYLHGVFSLGRPK